MDDPITDEIVTRTVCFSSDGYTCYVETEIQVRHCGAYFLYYLPDISLFGRYCSV